MTICRFAEHVSKIRGIIGRIIPSRVLPNASRPLGTVVISFTVVGLRMRCPLSSPPFMSAAQSNAISSAQGKDSCVAAYAGIYNSCQRVVNSTAQNLTCFLFFCGCYDICPRMVFFAQTGRLTVLQYPFWSSRQGM